MIGAFLSVAAILWVALPGDLGRFKWPVLVGLLLILAVIASAWYWRARKILKELEISGQTVEGLVVDLREVRPTGKFGLEDEHAMPHFYATYRFRCGKEYSGEEYLDSRLIEEIGGEWRVAMAIGKKALVRYLPRDPRISRLESVL